MINVFGGQQLLRLGKDEKAKAKAKAKRRDGRPDQGQRQGECENGVREIVDCAARNTNAR